MSLKLSKVDEAWEKLFDKYNILKKLEEQEVFQLTSSQINEFREARLMTKFDHSSNLPRLFTENNLSILPNSRGTYIIGKFEAYKKLDFEIISPKTKYIPDFIQSFDTMDITSESFALNVAHMSGMIDEVMATPYNSPKSLLTLSGRMSSGILDFNIRTMTDNFYRCDVKNSQIEIDGSYENLHSIAIIEAKNKIPIDFHIRQLYYPYRVYQNLNTTKEITPVFFTFADDIFSFHIYIFEDTMDYSSIKKVKQMDFILNNSLNITLSEVKEISAKSPCLDERIDIPYPQANSFIRILDMIDYLKTPKNKYELANDYGFDVRQSDYYANALVYLGFANKNEDKKFVLNDLGFKIDQMNNNNNRNIEIIKHILNNKTFKLAFDSTIENSGDYDVKYITEVLFKNVPSIKSWSTASRRASTVISWLNWMFSVIDY